MNRIAELRVPRGDGCGELDGGFISHQRESPRPSMQFDSADNPETRDTHHVCPKPSPIAESAVRRTQDTDDVA